MVNAFGEIEECVIVFHCLTHIIFEFYFVVKHLSITKLPIYEDDHDDGCLL